MLSSLWIYRISARQAPWRLLIISFILPPATTKMGKWRGTSWLRAFKSPSSQAGSELETTILQSRLVSFCYNFGPLQWSPNPWWHLRLNSSYWGVSHTLNKPPWPLQRAGLRVWKASSHPKARSVLEDSLIATCAFLPFPTDSGPRAPGLSQSWFPSPLPCFLGSW